MLHTPCTSVPNSSIHTIQAGAKVFRPLQITLVGQLLYYLLHIEGVLYELR